jgi:hypothetical protein
MTAAARNLLSCRLAAGVMPPRCRDHRRAANPARAFSAFTPQLPCLWLTLPSRSAVARAGPLPDPWF